MTAYPGRLYHNTPGWVSDGARFHIRVRAESAQSPPLTHTFLAPRLLAAAGHYHDFGHWWGELFLLMPHLHAILTFPRAQSMSEVMRSWKRATMRLHAVVWQDGYFDHRLRTDSESAEKWNYIRLNPVAKTLCSAEDEWPWWWSAVVANPRLRTNI